MIRYEAVTLEDGRRLFLKNPVVIQFLGAAALTGVQVNGEGDEGDVDRKHIIQLEMIRRRRPVAMGLKYGRLVSLKDAARQREEVTA